MARLNITEQTPGQFVVEGALTFSSIDKKTVKSFNFLKSAERICIDLQKVETTDSAGLALMIEWIKQSKLYNTELAFKNIPQQLLALAKLSGFDANEYLADATD
ncbi:STAS domain-containing protein [Methylomarinum sp. Ch1-1]|uniref:STAS domain-containing protein n=1 Tax=Methylomarinum roseum TaxID=3067653 RepID=A0AAU7NY95_9GAMM|nr:STAS domain-containing protein [Methylomarinum sp. Ch1-1]MDP4521967.1 STAS domain-containing protein [Methylomarinum sp. Ch1-1]